MQITETPRGFKIIKFQDRNGAQCEIQESSIATESAIWFGTGNNRMHLTQKIAKQLIPILDYFNRFGNLYLEAESKLPEKLQPTSLENTIVRYVSKPAIKDEVVRGDKVFKLVRRAEYTYDDSGYVNDYRFGIYAHRKKNGKIIYRIIHWHEDEVYYERKTKSFEKAIRCLDDLITISSWDIAGCWCIEDLRRMRRYLKEKENDEKRTFLTRSSAENGRSQP